MSLYYINNQIPLFQGSDISLKFGEKDTFISKNIEFIHSENERRN